jgi:hypothetical protein
MTRDELNTIFDRQMHGYGRKQADTDVLALLGEIHRLIDLGDSMSAAIYVDMDEYGFEPVLAAAKAAWDADR